MSGWLVFVRERVPLVSYVLLSFGIALSGTWVGQGPLFTNVAWEPLAWAFAGIFPFFVLLRFMDEAKDYEKDVVAHPERPLPRGVLPVSQVRKTIPWLSVAMLAFAGLLALRGQSAAAQAYVAVTIWLWLMYKEFYVGESLSSAPMLYAFSHQIILVPLCAFPTLLVRGELSSEALWFGLMILGAFFSYEIARKLDPKAHPLLKTYAQVYGPVRTGMFLVVTSAWAVIGAANLNLAGWSLIGVGLVLVFYSLYLLKPSRFKWAEGAATLSLLLHIFAYTLQRIIERG